MGECFFWYRSTQVVPDNTETRVRVLNGPFSATTQVSRYQTEKVKPIWILLKQETVGGSGISWAICKCASCSRQITTPAPHHSVFTGQLPFLPPNQQRQSNEGVLYPRQWAVKLLCVCVKLPVYNKISQETRNIATSVSRKQ